MSIEDNKRIVRRFVDEVLIGGNIALLDEIADPQLVNHAAAPQARHGVEGIKRVVGGSRQAMPDQKWTNELIVAEGDLVSFYAVREATWQAESFRGIATSPGKRIAVEMVHLFRIREQKIVEHWAVRDDLGLMQQLGAVK
jgi:predicted ester cyclase